METIKRYYRVDPRQICYLRFIFEAYDGIGGLTTLDPDEGMIEFFISPGCERDVETVLQDLKKYVMIEEIFPPKIKGGIEWES